MKYNRQKIAILSILMMFTIMVAAPGSASAQGTLEFSMSRDFGTGLGTSIEGLFTIHGSGPAEVIGISILFNDVEVHAVDSNTVDWQFNTNDYPSGETNITLYGWDADDGTYIAMVTRNFLTAESSNLFTFGILAFAGVVIVLSFVFKFGRFRKPKSKQ